VSLVPQRLSDPRSFLRWDSTRVELQEELFATHSLVALADLAGTDSESEEAAKKPEIARLGPPHEA
jgi:hypothetical protein